MRKTIPLYTTLLSLILAHCTLSLDCPKGQYYNELSHICDPCPAECLTSPPPPNTPASKQKLCRKLTSQCAIYSTPSPTPTASTESTASNGTAASSASSSDKQLSPAGIAAVAITVGTVAVAALILLAVFLYRRRINGDAKSSSADPARAGVVEVQESVDKSEMQPLNPAAAEAAADDGDCSKPGSSGSTRENTGQEASDAIEGGKGDVGKKVYPKPTPLPAFEDQSHSERA